MFKEVDTHEIDRSFNFTPKSRINNGEYFVYVVLCILIASSPINTEIVGWDPNLQKLDHIFRLCALLIAT